MKVKKWLFILSLTIGIIASCEKEDSYKSNGVITGVDGRFCGCCGGYFIDVDNSSYNIETLPPSSGIDLLKDTFPINVSLNWKFDRDCGGIQYIKITKIAKR